MYKQSQNKYSGLSYNVKVYLKSARIKFHIPMWYYMFRIMHLWCGGTH